MGTVILGSGIAGISAGYHLEKEGSMGEKVMTTNIMNIVMTSSDEYSIHCGTLIISILKNSLPDEKFNFFILESNISETHKNKLRELARIKPFNIQFIKVDESIFNNPSYAIDIKRMPGFTIQTFYKYLIADLLKDINRVLYMDVDIIVRCSLKDLYNTDLGENYIAASEDLGWPDSISLLKKKLDVENYFNAGVVLYDLKKCRENKIFQQLLQNHINLFNSNKITYLDQCVLNYTFNNKVKLIDKRYNVIWAKAHAELKKALKKPYIVHYTSLRKPWNMSFQHKYAREYFKYLKYSTFTEAKGLICAYKKHYFKKFTRTLKTIFDFVKSYFLFPWYVYKTYKLVKKRLK